jgi:hypothetical protein
LRKDYIFEFVGRLREAVRTARQTTRSAGTGGFGSGYGPGPRPQRPKVLQVIQRDGAGRVVVPSLRPSPLLQPPWQGAERSLMHMLLTHPLVLEDSDLDNLRQEVLKHQDRWGHLDFAGVQRYLKSCGFSQILVRLLEASAHDPSAYLRPDADVEVVRAAWRGVHGRYRQKELAADVHLAQQQIAADLTDETFGYFNALSSLKQQGGDM